VVLSVDPNTNQGIVGRIDSSRVAALTLVRRLRPPFHEGEPRLFLFNPALAFRQSVHSTVERVKGTQSLNIQALREKGTFVEESSFANLREKSRRRLLQGFVPIGQREEIFR
jgi:hypothetical protein